MQLNHTIEWTKKSVVETEQCQSLLGIMSVELLTPGVKPPSNAASKTSSRLDTKTNVKDFYSNDKVTWTVSKRWLALCLLKKSTCNPWLGWASSNSQQSNGRHQCSAIVQYWWDRSTICCCFKSMLSPHESVWAYTILASVAYFAGPVMNKNDVIYKTNST